MIICGIDYSINSPGVTVLNLENEMLGQIRKRYIAFTQTKKWESSRRQGKIFSYKKKQFSNYIEQNEWIIETIKRQLHNVDYVAFEDYAYGATGKVFHIAEATGLAKYFFYKMGTKLRFYDPGTIKMFATGKGNADKIRMEDCYNEKHNDTKFDLEFLPKYKSPKSDIIDSHYIARLLQQELIIRKNLWSPEKGTVLHKIFNRVTKGNPIKLLEREFIQEKQ